MNKIYRLVWSELARTWVAVAEIARGRGTAYWPDAVDACLKLFREEGYMLPP